jgi:thiaminase
MATKYTEKLMKSSASQLSAYPHCVHQLLDGTLPTTVFRDLVIQDIIINEHWKKFLAVLIAKIPHKYNKNLGNKNPSIFLATMIVNHEKEKVTERIRHELKIKNEEIHPTLVTKAVCDFLMATVYNRTYKDALVVLFASSRCLPEKLNLTGGNPLHNEWIQAHIHFVEVLGSWAVDALNEIRGNDDVNHKHQQLYTCAINYENTFWASIENSNQYSWAM